MPLHRINQRIILFVHIPKNGGSTIEAWLNDLGPLALKYPGRCDGLLLPPQHFHADLVRAIIPEDFYDDAFCIVRDPLERLLSEYRWAHRNRVLGTNGPFFLMGMSQDTAISRHFARWVRKQFSRTRKDPLTRGNHIRPQSDFLDIGKCRVYRFEEGFVSIMSDLANRWNVPIPEVVPHENATRKVSVQIDIKTRRLIDKFYANDFARFGYPLAADRD